MLVTALLVGLGRAGSCDNSDYTTVIGSTKYTVDNISTAPNSNLDILAVGQST